METSNGPVCCDVPQAAELSKTSPGAPRSASEPAQCFPAVKLSLYESIVKQLYDDGFEDVGALLCSKLGLDASSVSLVFPNDALYAVYERGLFNLKSCCRCGPNSCSSEFGLEAVKNGSKENDVSTSSAARQSNRLALTDSAGRCDGSWVSVTSLGNAEIEKLPSTAPPSLLSGCGNATSSVPEVPTPIENDVNVPPLTKVEEVWSTLHKNACTVVALSPDGRYAASGGEDHAVRLMVQQNELTSENMDRTFLDDKKKYNFSSRKVWTRVFQDHSDHVTALTFSRDSRFLISGSKDHTIKLYEPSKSKHRRAAHTLRDFSEILCLEVHPTNTFLYSGTAHSAIRCYDLNTLECFTAMHSKDQHNSGITGLVCSENGSYLVSCSRDGTIQVWDARSTRCVNKLYAAHGGFDVCSVSLSKQKQHMLLSGGSDGKARLWDLRSGQEITFYAETHDVRRSARRTQALFLADQRYVACLWEDSQKDAVLFNTATGDMLNTLNAHSCQVKHIAANRKTNALLTAGSDFRCRYFQLASDASSTVTQSEGLDISA